MNRTALATVFAAGAMLALANSASALTTVSLIDTSTQGVGNDAGVAYAVGYNGTVPTGASFDTTPLVTPPPVNSSGVYQSPFNNTSADASTYFSVGAVDGAGDGAASPTTLSYGVSNDQTVFTILWGSIDSYNTISFFNNGALVEDYTGTDIATLFSLPGGPVNYEQVALLNFSFTGGTVFDSVKFESSQAAFEFAFAPVPIPAALPMLMAAVAGLGFAGWRSNRRPA